VSPELDHVVHAEAPGHARRVVARAIVDDQNLDRVDAVDVARQVAQRAGRLSASFRHGIWMMSLFTAACWVWRSESCCRG